MADELDAELLALAGGDDDGVDTADVAEQPAQTPTPQPSPHGDLSDDLEKPSVAKKGLATKKKSMSSRGAARRRRREDSGDDSDGDDVSDADSLGSGAMDESDSEAGEIDEDDDDDLFPLEGQFYDEKDRREIMALPEVRREQILASRQDEAMRKRQDAQLKHLLKRQEQDRERTEKRKRKASATDLDDSPRKSSRPRTKQTEALEGFKRQREQALKDREKSAADRRNRRRSPSATRSDEDAEGESEVEWDDGVRNREREEPPPELHDYERVRVGRSNFAKVCFYPGFENAIKGCYTRVSVGADRTTGQNVYRMAQIKGFAEGKPYEIEAANGKHYWTDQYAIVAHGKSEKEWPFIACSDSKITEQEFNRWKIAVTNDSLRLPTKEQLRKSLQSIHELLDQEWTDTKIREKIARQNKLAHLAKPTNGTRTPDFSSPIPNGTPKNRESMSQADRLYHLNQQNRKKNLEEIRKAQLAEKKRDAESRAKAAARKAEQERLEAEAAAAKAAKESLQVPGADVDDLFGSDVSRSGTPAPGTASGITSGVNTPKRSGTPLGKKIFEKKEKEEKKGLPTFKKRNMDDEVIGSMDLVIDIDI